MKAFASPSKASMRRGRAFMGARAHTVKPFKLGHVRMLNGGGGLGDAANGSFDPVKVFESVNERRLYFESLQGTVPTFKDTLSYGVRADEADPSKWAYTLTDSYQRVYSEGGFLSKNEALAAYEKAQERLLSEPLTRLVRERIRERYEPAARAERHLEERESFRNTREANLSAAIRSLPTKLVTDLEARAMGEDALVAMEQESVLHARELWLQCDPQTRALAEAVAARSRQTMTSTFNAHRWLGEILRFQQSNRGNTSSFIYLLLSSDPALWPALHHLLGIDRVPILGTVTTQERWNALFLPDKVKEPQVIVRLDEMFPDAAARESRTNIKHYNTAVKQVRYSELAVLLRAQHMLACAEPFDVPAHAAAVIESAAVVRAYTPYDEVPKQSRRPGPVHDQLRYGLKESNLYPEHLVSHLSQLVAARDALRSSMPVLFEEGIMAAKRLPDLAGSRGVADARSALDAVQDDLFVISSKAAMLADQSRRVQRGVQRVFAESLEVDRDNFVPLVVARSAMHHPELIKLGLVECEEIEDPVEAALAAPFRMLANDPESDRVLVNAARAEAVERAEAFLARSRELLPLAKRHSLYSFLGKVAFKEQINHIALAGAHYRIAQLVGTHGDNELLGLLGEFFALDAFQFITTQSIVRDQVEVAQAVLRPEVPTQFFMLPIGETKQAYELPVTYDMDTGLPIPEAATDLHRLARNVSPTSVSSSEDLLPAQRAFPEARVRKASSNAIPPIMYRTSTSRAKNTFKRGAMLDWLGFDCNWYESSDDAARTWYSPNIVGGASTQALQADQLVALRNVTLAGFEDRAKLAAMHASLLPQGQREALEVAHQIVKTVPPSSIREICAILTSHWSQPPPVFFEFGRPRQPYKAGEGSNERLRKSLFSVIGHELSLRPLVAQIVQNAIHLTPEMIYAVDFVIGANQRIGTESDEDDMGLSAEVSAVALTSGQPQARGFGVAEVTDGLHVHRDQKKSRYVFADLAEIGSKPGVLVDPEMVALRGDEEWVGRTVYMADIPTTLYKSHIKTIVEQAFGEVEAVTFHRERTEAAIMTAQILQRALQAPANKKRYKKASAASIDESDQLSHRITFTNPQDVPAQLEARVLQLEAFKERRKRFETALDKYVRAGYDAVLWVNENWGVAEMVHAAESVSTMSRTAQKQHCQKLGIDYEPIRALLQGRKSKSDKLSESIFTAIDEARSGLRLHDDLIERVRVANRDVEAAWRNYQRVIKRATGMEPAWPETLEELNARGDEIIVGGRKKVEKKTKEMALKTKLDKYASAEEDAQRAFIEFQNAVMYAKSLERVIPQHYRGQVAALETLASLIREVDRRQSIVEFANRSSENEGIVLGAVSSDSGDAGAANGDVVVIGLLSPRLDDGADARSHGILNLEVQAAERDEDADEEHAYAMTEAVFYSDEDEQEMYEAALEEFENEEADEDDVTDDDLLVAAVDKPNKSNRLAENSRLEQSAQNVASTFATVYEGMRATSLGEQIKQAAVLRKLVQKVSRGGQDQAKSVQDMVNSLAPKTGHYAFVTFKSRESYEKATSRAIRSFGITLCVPKETARNREPISSAELLDLDGPRKNFDHYVAAVQPASLRKGLFIEGFSEGMRARQVVQICQDILRPTFPSLRMNVPDPNKVISKGGCYIEFSSHAESRAAYEALKDRIVAGRKLTVGWAERRRRLKPIAEQQGRRRASKFGSSDRLVTATEVPFDPFDRFN